MNSLEKFKVHYISLYFDPINRIGKPDFRKFVLKASRFMPRRQIERLKRKRQERKEDESFNEILAKALLHRAAWLARFW